MHRLKIYKQRTPKTDLKQTHFKSRNGIYKYKYKMQYKCTVKNTLCRKAAEIYMSQDPHWTPHPPPQQNRRTMQVITKKRIASTTFLVPTPLDLVVLLTISLTEFGKWSMHFTASPQTPRSPIVCIAAVKFVICHPAVEI